MTTSHDQVARLLALTPYLRARPWAPIDEVARAFAVTRAQVYEDLRVLLFCGLPGGLPGDLIDVDLEAAREEGLVNLTNADFLDRPLRLRADEALGLIVALQAVEEVATGETARAAAGVLAKLRGLVGSEAAQRARIELVSGSPDVRARLTAAIERGERVVLTYDGLSRGETSTPVVDPVRVSVWDGVAYLVAFALERADWRTYRLDRIVAVRAAGEPAADHGPAPEAEAGWFDAVSPDNEVTLRLDGAAAWVGEYYPTRRITALPGGEVEVVLPVADPRWLTGLLLQLGPLVRAVDPPRAAADALAQARAALSWYAGADRL